MDEWNKCQLQEVVHYPFMATLKTVVLTASGSTFYMLESMFNILGELFHIILLAAMASFLYSSVDMNTEFIEPM